MKNIVVSGVSKGLGLAIADHLLKTGHTVYGISRSCPPALETLKRTYPDHLHLIELDLSKAESVQDSLFKTHLTLDTPIAGFINNAASAYDDIVTNLNIDPLKHMFELNVFTPMMMVKQVIRNMLYHRTAGSIVHISSISVHTGYKGLAMYAATKGALEAFSKNTAREWGIRGIRSNCIVAGFMETEMSQTLSEEQRNKIYGRTALKKETSKASVAATSAFLLSEAAASITGQNIFVDSGTI
ncbi:MAG: SDR family NAD(P)-dependent oxidoreductase [Candidatus Margulisiibacteriota bacterium]